jgi:hypothetical protein
MNVFKINLITKHDQLLSSIIYSTIVISTIITRWIRGELRQLLNGTLTIFNEHQKTERRNSFWII